ncbi:flagellar hook-length control protein FliK [Marinococcus luteus]|uniref:flagellar hook-length control protein FliK n=1 Tax=Marinococcus luteus TaxID=1122204 RepID=UPI002ACCA24F|nr:flagellar hook-length control protein FliK [Marinococcus luteus]MDZ5781812.1 flagellar hook-length control protein FliK [Marinococcus luteus]
METAITGRPASPGQAAALVPAQTGGGPSAFAALFAGAAALTGKQPVMEKGTENAGPSAEQIMEAIEADPETINALMEQHPEFEEAVMFIAELVRNEQGGEGPVKEETPEEMPAEMENIFTKLAAVLHSPDGETAAGKDGAGKAELPVLEQLAARFNDLAPRNQQAIQVAAEKLQEAAGALLSKAMEGEGKKQTEEVFTSRLNEMAALFSKVLSDKTEDVLPEAALAASAVAAGAPIKEDGLKAKQKNGQPARALAQKEMSPMEKIDILFPRKTAEVRQLISFLDQQADAKSSAEKRPQLLPQVPAGWMSPANGRSAVADADIQMIKRDLQQWQKYLSEREQPGTWVPKALQPSTGEQSERQLTAFMQSLSALVKKQPSASSTADAGWNEAFTKQLEQILQSIRGDSGKTSYSPAATAGVGEARALQLNTPLVIQLPPASEGNKRQAEFLKQFQQTLGTMNAAQLKNGASYTIRLHPEHLGRLDVKLTKIEGQWTAQLITTSKGAQELVEGSVHKLRHSFLQQNLQVERIEVAEHPDFYKEEEQKEEPEEQREAVNMQEESSEEERSFEDILQQLSVNERI